ncbi:MAG: acyltransferase family protein [Eubacteriales bacterium]|nr:acyltransferase family protein [Eubacteriales bacterium]
MTQKKFESITVLKGLACIVVFVAHWKAFFESLGSPKLDYLVFEGPLVILIYSSMGVSVFLMLSAALTALKIYRREAELKEMKLADEMPRVFSDIKKRYVTLCIPIFITSMLVFICQRLGLLFSSEAGAALSNDFIAGLYTEPLKLVRLVTISFATALFRQENSVYVPFWMMCYIFLGSLISMGMSYVMLSLDRRWKMLTAGFLIIVMSLLDSFFLTTILGNIIGLALARGKASVPKANGLRLKRTLIGGAVLLAGIWLSSKVYVFVWDLEHEYGLAAPLSDAWFWQVWCGVMIIIGFILLYENLVAMLPGMILRRLLEMLGSISYEVFLTHWLVMCSFSCRFYLTHISDHMHISILLNFILSLIITICLSIAYYFFMKLIMGSIAGAAAKWKK